jgi:hypothetical protein
MDLKQILQEKENLVRTLQALQAASDVAVQVFEQRTGTQVSGIRTTHVHEVGTSWPTSIVEDVVVVL